MKGSLCTLPKREERKWGGEKSLSEPYRHSSATICAATTRKLLVCRFKCRREKWCLIVGGVYKRFLKSVSSSYLLGHCANNYIYIQLFLTLIDNYKKKKSQSEMAKTPLNPGQEKQKNKGSSVITLFNKTRKPKMPFSPCYNFCF
jgi:hypothetical protein